MDPERTAKAVAAPGTIALGGKTYLVAQPTPQDLETVGRYLRKLLRNPLKALVADIESLPESIRAMAMDAAMKIQANPPTPKTKEEAAEACQALIQTPEGFRFLLWTILRKNHPDLTLEQLKPLVTDANVDELAERLAEEAGLADLGKSLGGGGSSTGSPPPTSPS